LRGSTEVFQIVASDQAGSRGVAVAHNWVVPLRRYGVRPPLFCASALGGDAFDYRDLALALPEDQPVYSLRMPGLSEAKDFPTVEHVAAAYVLKVREMQRHGPYYLCGHSFGGLVVYEMARFLAREGEDVGLVALLDAEVPAYSRTLSLGQRTKYYLVYTFDRLAKYGRNLFRGRIDQVLVSAVNTSVGWVKRFAWRAAPALFGVVGHEVPSQIRSNHLVFTTAWWAYNPSEYGGRVDLFFASGRPPEYDVDRTLGWRTFATDLVLSVVPGAHDTMLHPPFVVALAERLTPLLGDELLDGVQSKEARLD
jgi:thioesterase domain-containing protein